MNYIKWRTLLITCLICLLPIVLGIIWWESLPDTMAIHFNINNEPDNFASKGFVVFGMPVLMMLLQIICCFINKISSTDLSGKNQCKNQRNKRNSSSILCHILSSCNGRIQKVHFSHQRRKLHNQHTDKHNTD